MKSAFKQSFCVKRYELAVNLYVLCVQQGETDTLCGRTSKKFPIPISGPPPNFIAPYQGCQHPHQIKANQSTFVKRHKSRANRRRVMWKCAVTSGHPCWRTFALYIDFISHQNAASYTLHTTQHQNKNS